MAILNAFHLKKYYGKDESLVKALDDVNVSVETDSLLPSSVYPAAENLPC